MDYRSLIELKETEQLKTLMKENPDINQLEELLHTQHRQTILNLIFHIDITNNSRIILALIGILKLAGNQEKNGSLEGDNLNRPSESLRNPGALNRLNNKHLSSNCMPTDNCRLLLFIHQQVMTSMTKSFKLETISYFLNIEIEIASVFSFIKDTMTISPANWHQRDIHSRTTISTLESFDILEFVSLFITKYDMVDVKVKYFILLFKHFIEMSYFYSALVCLKRISDLTHVDIDHELIDQLRGLVAKKNEGKKFEYLFDKEFKDVDVLEGLFIPEKVPNRKNKKIEGNKNDCSDDISERDSEENCINNNENINRSDIDCNNIGNDKHFKLKIILPDGKPIEIKITRFERFWGFYTPGFKSKIEIELIEFLSKNEIYFEIQNGEICCGEFKGTDFGTEKKKLLMELEYGADKEKSKGADNNNKEAHNKNKEADNKNKGDVKCNRSVMKSDSKENKVKHDLFTRRYFLFGRYSTLEPKYREDAAFEERLRNWRANFKSLEQTNEKIKSAYEKNKDEIEILVGELKSKLKRLEKEEKKKAEMASLKAPVSVAEGASCSGSRSVKRGGSWRTEPVVRLSSVDKKWLGETSSSKRENLGCNTERISKEKTGCDIYMDKINAKQPPLESFSASKGKSSSDLKGKPAGIYVPPHLRK